MSNLTPWERLVLALFVRAVRDVDGRDQEHREDAVEFLESSGAAALADALGYDLGRFRKGVEVLTGQLEQAA